MQAPPAFETFEHDVDIGVRGRGATLGEAFANVGRALTSVVTDPEQVRETTSVEIACEAGDPWPPSCPRNRLNWEITR